MPFLGLLSPGPVIEAPTRMESPRGTRARLSLAVLAIIIVAIASALHIRAQDNQRSNSCAVVDEVQNMDAQPNVDCLTK